MPRKTRGRKAIKQPIKIALIGLGRMGRNHLRLLQVLPEFEVVAVVEPRPQDFACTCPFLKKLEQLDEIEFEAAVVATPTSTHFAVTSWLLANGKDVLVEKPLASTAREAEALVSLALKYRRKLAVGYVERFNPVVHKLRDVIAGGYVGKPIHYNFTRVGGYPNEHGRGNNVLLDLAVHDLDVLRLLQGEMRVVASACHSTVKRNILDTAEIMLRSPRNGPSASIHVNWVTPAKIRTLRVTGTGGVGIIDYMLQTCTVYGGYLLGPRLYPGLSFEQLKQAYQGNDKIEFEVKKVEPLRNELEDFARYVRGLPNNSCTGTEAVYSLAIAEEVFRNV